MKFRSPSSLASTKLTEPKPYEETPENIITDEAFTPPNQALCGSAALREYPGQPKPLSLRDFPTFASPFNRSLGSVAPISLGGDLKNRASQSGESLASRRTALIPQKSLGLRRHSNRSMEPRSIDANRHQGRFASLRAHRLSLTRLAPTKGRVKLAARAWPASARARQARHQGPRLLQTQDPKSQRRIKKSNPPRLRQLPGRSHRLSWNPKSLSQSRELRIPHCIGL
jgi:hypothetical protein